MKFIISIILIALLSFVFCLYLPWWSISFAAFIIALLIPQTARLSFWAGFTGVFLLWGGLSFWISKNNDHILAHKISLLLLKTDSPFLLILATAVIGGLIAGLGAMTASWLHKKPIHS